MTQLVALQSFSGPDGRFARGEVFNIEDQSRVDFLTAESKVPGVPPYAQIVGGAEVAPAPVAPVVAAAPAVAAPVARPVRPAPVVDGTTPAN